MTTLTTLPFPSKAAEAIMDTSLKPPAVRYFEIHYQFVALL